VSELEVLVDACLMPAFIGARPPDWATEAVSAGLAGICLYGHNVTARGKPSDTRDRIRLATAALRDAAPDVLVAIDEEGGDVTRIDYLTGSRYPGNLALGVVDDIELTTAVARAIGTELSDIGVNVALAPSVDVNSDPRNPVIGVRSFGADPALVSRHGAAFIGGLQGSGVAATAKHFPGHGATVVDSHLGLPTVDVPLEKFRHRDLPPFRAAVAAGVDVVMTSHVVFGALDRQPATLSRRLLVDMLRGELGFEGVVMTDALDMAAVRAAHGIAGAAARALAAGADLLLLGAQDGREQLAAVRSAVVQHIEDGTISAARLDEAAGRIRALRGRLTRDRRRPGQPDVAIGAEAARRALRSRGTGPLSGPAVVVELRQAANLAVGEARWTLAEPLRDLGLVARSLTVEESGAATDDVISHGEGHPLVLVVRDAYRHAWQAALVGAVIARRPDTVLVAIGMPEDADLGGTSVVCTHGASAVGIAAAVDLLAGRSSA
jgi:beta-N-acetylhexosaminidase